MDITTPAPRRRVAIIGAGPGGLAAALAFHHAGHEVRLFERQDAVKPLGGAVLLSLPVLSVLRDMGVDIRELGASGVTEFRNHRGRLRTRLPFNPRAEARAGIPGWHYGMLRSAAIERMLAVMPPGLIHPGKHFARYDEQADSITAHFDDGTRWEADLLVGADGIRSAVARQAFGELGLFHCGIQVWLAWCHCDDVPRGVGWISHSRNVQASFFPILHEGKPAVEWWVVEPWKEGQRFAGDVRTHLTNHLRGWTDPLPRLAAATDFERNCFRWDIYNRPALPSWSKGRVSFVGDAVHPVSPYAAYGMGMAIEDGWWLAKCLEGVDLAQRDALAQGLARYDRQRVGYTNKNAKLARYLGYLFHRTPWPLSALRDVVFDHTRLLEAMLVETYLKDAETQMETLPIAAR
ncbi:FAD-dependent oxidoreductase [Methylibium rhizosphaerae]|uniref:FAD-dependent oxidoreductase n=1 Tax=Methylibium rhizosphaerae TaxID=2570323 RepID=UPI001128E990|nr:FAD-dependent monooxygenase [Methylibium rhizosphaerae]